jgi:hypothetical protein
MPVGRKRDRRTALKLFGELQAEGFTGTYCRVTEFIRRWRADGGAAVSKAFVPLKFRIGRSLPVRLERRASGHRRRLAQAAGGAPEALRQRAFRVVAYPQSHEMLFDAPTRLCRVGRHPRRGIYDNMKTAVDKVKKGKSGSSMPRFCRDGLALPVRPGLLQRRLGWEKGVVEKNVQDSRRRIWQDAGKERFGSFAELNVWLLERCRALWQELRHPEYGDLTVAEMLEHEQPHLMPMVTPFDGYVETLGKVSSTCLVTAGPQPLLGAVRTVGQWSACGSIRSGSTSWPR